MLKQGGKLPEKGVNGKWRGDKTDSAWSYWPL